jgi:hypothetical protein
MSITAPIPAKDHVARCEATIHVSEGFHPRLFKVSHNGVESFPFVVCSQCLRRFRPFNRERLGVMGSHLRKER